ncbi:hypothetical protein KFL_017530010 [Klebsormidium nitens]|uniref:Integrase catalytic domain-containing protein n=1 Tax=Klebsormidium nitens TaxID=105231 RepID=A0A1Y1IRX7_KLENI|nr:hypothetical protein KFL_017530010 [Klebsormidium nitens]|eukprot:GAQ93645.1 hypothetical protein KFL_017530010 [Klebsormidium nitens]
MDNVVGMEAVKRGGRCEIETVGRHMAFLAREPVRGNQACATTKRPVRAKNVVERWPTPVASVGGRRYFATFLDDYSKLSVVVPMKQKSEVATVTEHVVNRLKLQTRKKLKSVRTDRGKEYVNKAFTYVFGGKGTVHEKTAPYSAEQNGSAERLNRDLEEKTRAMLEDSGLAKELC